MQIITLGDVVMNLKYFIKAKRLPPAGGGLVVRVTMERGEDEDLLSPHAEKLLSRLGEIERERTRPRPTPEGIDVSDRIVVEDATPTPAAPGPRRRKGSR